MSSGTYRRWPAAARGLAEGIDAAVTASQGADAEAFDEAVTGLRRSDREQLMQVLGTILQWALEQVHPDGLDSDDARRVLDDARLAHASWYPELDDDALLRALAATLGVGDEVGDPADGAGVDPQAVLVHGLLLASSVLSGAALPVAPALDAALGELMRAQTIELP